MPISVRTSAPMNCMHTDVFSVAQMQNYAINNKLTPFISMQNHYNLVYREEEREMMPTLKVSWSTLLCDVRS
jgi:aryl-alcohol dehydrogenase-like predicted oxidoreductase